MVTTPDSVHLTDYAEKADGRCSPGAVRWLSSTFSRSCCPRFFRRNNWFATRSF